MKPAKILIVESNSFTLAETQRALSSIYTVHTAMNAPDGLRLLQQSGPFQVVISELQLGEASGINFLRDVMSASPATIRIAMTAATAVAPLISVVNEAAVFQVLAKPCPAEKLQQTVESALRRHSESMVERELVDRTLSGAITVLSEVLSAVDPLSFGRSMAMRQNVRNLAKELELRSSWELEVAAMLCNLGLITIPASLIAKWNSKASLTAVETEIVQRYPASGRTLIAKIPRLEKVADIVHYQNKNYDGSGFPNDSVKGEQIPYGARVLKVLIDLAEIELRGIGRQEALAAMNNSQARYDPKIFQVALRFFGYAPGNGNAVRRPVATPVLAKELRTGYVLASNVETADGTKLMAPGFTITETLLERINNFGALSGIREPILVEKPA